MVSPFNAIGDGIASVSQSLSDNFTQNWQKFGQLLNYINPVHEDFFLSGLIEFIQNTFDPASETFFLKVAFVPDMEEIEAKNDLLKQTISQKLGADSAIGKVQELANNSGSAPDFQADLSVYGVGTFSTKVINIDWFETHKDKIFGWIRGFAYFVLVSINFNHIYKLMLGGAPILAGTMADSQNKGGQT